MTPLSTRTRRFFMLLFFGVGIALIPMVIFYADGWRFKSGFGFVKTGGVFVAVPYQDAHISINGEQVGASSFLSRGLYVDNLAPSSYEVLVTKDGFTDWKRTIVVEPQIVTDMYVHMIPRVVHIQPLIVTDVSTTSPHISKDADIAYRAVFAARRVASSTVPVATSGSVGLYIDHGSLIVKWIGRGNPTSEFCGRPSYCVRQITIENAGVTRALFFGGAVVYRTAGGRIVWSEFDIRQEPIKVELFSHEGADVSIIDGNFIIKSAGKLYQMESF